MIDDSKKRILQEKLGLMVIPPRDPRKKLLHIAEIDALKNVIKESSKPFAGLFLFGISGAGKSYFTECFEKEVERNFTISIEEFRPLRKNFYTIKEAYLLAENARDQKFYSDLLEQIDFL